MTEEEYQKRISELETQVDGFVRQLQRNAQDMKKKDEDRKLAKEFLDEHLKTHQFGTKEYEDVDRLIQVLRTR